MPSVAIPGPLADDRRILRLVLKWLWAGVLEDGVVTVEEKGTGQGQGSRIRVCGPMLGVVTETSGLPDPLTEPAKDETSVQTAGLF